MSLTTRRSANPPKGATITLAGSLLFATTADGASEQSVRLREYLHELAAYYSIPATSVRDHLLGRFMTLVQQWRQDTQFLSSTSEIAMHPAYQSIIGMGRAALPWILEDLRRTMAWWFWALRAISNEDPVPPGDRGSVERMRDAWLRWGAAKGLLPA